MFRTKRSGWHASSFAAAIQLPTLWLAYLIALVQLSMTLMHSAAHISSYFMLDMAVTLLSGLWPCRMSCTKQL